MKKAHFCANVLPIGKARPRFSCTTLPDGNRRMHVHTDSATAAFESEIQWAYRTSNRGVFFKDLVNVSIIAYFPIPKSYTKKQRASIAAHEMLQGKKPDADNIAKAVLDGLNKVAFDDDSQVANLWVVKKYGEQAGVDVTIDGYYEGD